ncbi:MAG: hypothetical protein JW940_04770 [Polyangiaceae bacterium]|nr:hypothetical protein [Polyangiaceae bacterium]
MAFGMHVLLTLLAVFGALVFGFHPAVVTTKVALSSSLRERGQIDDLGAWFSAAQPRYDRWAEHHRTTRHAAAVHREDVSATEWPMFGSVFYMLSAEELLRSKQIVLTGQVRTSLAGAARVIADPVSGSWVRRKWGKSYLDKENVFYRMLLVLGLDSYGKMTNDTRYASLVAKHARGLSSELLAAPYRVLDDYPGECYPSDIVWATAAIARVETLSKAERARLSREVMASLAKQLSDEYGLPAMRVDSRTGRILQGSRGCSNSGLLSFAYELAPGTARDWYSRYEAHYWTKSRWLAGFREHARGARQAFADVDSGPILFGIGTAASLFGVGAARAAGRFDHAAPMTMEAVAAAWPTPFGLLVPGVMGWLAADSWSLGETAFLFAMTRPNHLDRAIAFTGSPPLVVLAYILLYWALGFGLLWLQWWHWRRWRTARVRAATTARA